MSERRQFVDLVRIFAGRMFEGHSTSNSIARVQFAIWSIALLTGPTFQVSGRSFKKYDWVWRRSPDFVDVATWPEKLFYLGFSTLGIGLLALVIWNGIFPDKRDASIFGSLPVRTRTLVLARLTALLGVALIFVVGFNMPAVLLYATPAGSFYGPLGTIRHAVAHIIANVAVALSVFACAVALQTLVVNVLNARWAARATLLLQAVLVVAVVQGVMLFPAATAMPAAAVPRSVSFEAMNPWSPPLWYLGLYETIGGSSRFEWAAYALRGAIASVAIVLVAFGMYAVTYARMARRTIESEEFGGRIAHRLIAPSTPRVAVRSFVLLTLARSRYHRLLLAIFLGFGLALVLPEILRAATAAAPGLPPVRTLAMPLILIFLAATGTRILFGIPQELEANWAFRLTETARRDSYLTGAADAAMLVCVASIVVLTTPLLWHGWGARVALTHALFCLVMGALLVEILMVTLRKVPFTCAYLPGSANVRTWWPVYLFAFTTFTFTMAAVSRSLMERPTVAAVFYAAAIGGGIAVRLWRRRMAETLAGFQYDEEREALPSVVA